MVRINTTRLLNRIYELAQIGALPREGVCRLAFSEEDKRGRDYVEKLMRDLGMHVMIDEVGNVLGIRGGDRHSSLVLTGSHTDTVAIAGRYDGALGVLAGLEVIQTLNEANIATNHALGVLSFVNEEGVRFSPDMMGSLFVAGSLSLEEVRLAKDIRGVTIGECLDQLDFAGSDSFRQLDVRGFVELHIEQGPVLEGEGIPVGVVDSVQGISWQEFQCVGVSNHAGTTPMSLRKDAGYVAAAVTCALRRMTQEIEGLRTTVGMLTFSPNLVNVIPEQATFTVDMRHPDGERLVHAEHLLSETVQDIASHEGVRVSARSLARVDPVNFDSGCVEIIQQTARQLGYAHRLMTSGAGHDAQLVSGLWPSAMIFIPSRDGISHNPLEYSSPDQIEAGANVLLNTLLTMAENT